MRLEVRVRQIITEISAKLSAKHLTVVMDTLHVHEMGNW